MFLCKTSTYGERFSDGGHFLLVLGSFLSDGFGVSYENRFLLKELQSQGLTAVIPLKSGVLSVGAQSFGYTEFRTYRSGLGYSLKLSDFF